MVQPSAEGDSSTTSRGNTERPWSVWSQSLGDRFLNPHFVITILLIAFWLSAIWLPFRGLLPLYQALAAATTEAQQKLALASLEGLTANAVAISGIFTTVIGVVLGHYFGQRGIENAERAQEEARESTREVAEAFDAQTDALTDELRKAGEDIELRNSAIEQAVSLLAGPDGELEVEDGSPLARLFSTLNEDQQPDAG